MATPKKVKGSSFGEECVDFIEYCEGRKNDGDNDDFMSGFDLDFTQHDLADGEEDHGTVISKLEDLSSISKGDKNAAEYVCDLLLKEKSSIFYSRTKIEERIEAFEEGGKETTRKKPRSRQEAMGYANYFSDELEDKSINELLNLNMHDLLEIAIPCLKAKKQYDLDVKFLTHVIKPIAEWLKEWKGHRKLRLVEEKKKKYENIIVKLKKRIEEEDDEILKIADQKTINFYQKEIEECDKSIAKSSSSTVLKRQDTAVLQENYEVAEAKLKKRVAEKRHGEGEVFDVDALIEDAAEDAAEDATSGGESEDDIQDTQDWEREEEELRKKRREEREEKIRKRRADAAEGRKKKKAKKSK
jgi:hypothetical protein